MTAPDFDPAQLPINVARAIFTDGSDEQWEAFTDEEREQALLGAHAAIAAHDNWLKDSGFRIVPPGAISAPKTDDEASVMVAAGRQFLAASKRKPKLLTGSGLIMPAGARLQ